MTPARARVPDLPAARPTSGAPTGMQSDAIHLMLTTSTSTERIAQAARANRTARVLRLRRLDRRAEQAATRARLVRLAMT